MAILVPNEVCTVNGVTVNEKIIPDGTRWKDGTKAKNAEFAAGSLYKKQQKLSDGTGKVQFVTIHNTNDLANVYDDGEQYTRATYNENMGSSRVHFYVDDTCAWQNLKAGTGLFANDPIGSAEVSWHSGDGSVATGGNMTSLSIEIIMGETAEHDRVAMDNGARLAAWLLWKHGLPIDALVTHTYWVNKSAGKSFSDRDVQSCNPISGKKWCPAYIFASSNANTALKNWKAFKQLVKGYLDALETANNQEGENDMDLARFKELFNQMCKELQDNDSGEWSKEAREWAISTGLTVGNGTQIDGAPNYAWEDFLTREQFFTVLYRLIKMTGMG